MKARDFVPHQIVDYVRLLKAKFRYPNSSIQSGFIAPTALIGRRCLISRYVEIGRGVSIGDYSYVNRGTIIASGAIGRFCSIGYNCQIGLPEHPLDFVSTSPLTYGQNNIFGTNCRWNDYGCPPAVGNDVWIGSGAHVLQGASVGDGAVVAAGAVVKGNVPPYGIVAGVPARLVRYRFDDASVEVLNRFQWWDLPDGKLQEFGDVFGSTEWQSLICGESTKA